MSRERQRDRGFALLAVLVAVVVLAGLAFDVLLQNRTAIVEAQAEVDRARMEAAANSAVALTLAGLGSGELDSRSPFDGTPRDYFENGVALTVVVEDERGKIPINVLSEQEAHRMFEAAGARGVQLDTLTDSFLDWRDDDEERRPFGAESHDYAPRGYRSRDGDLTSLGEMARIQGMTPALLARLAPAVTLWFGESGGFVEANASPLALATMSADGAESLTIVSGQHRTHRPAVVPGDADLALRGRRMSVRVVARDARGGVLHRATIVEFTGNPRQPLWIRARE